MGAPENTTASLEAVNRPGDRICPKATTKSRRTSCRHAWLPEHIDLFEKGIARKLDYSYSGPQGVAVARALNSGKIKLGAIHTYIELFARYFIDLRSGAERKCRHGSLRRDDNPFALPSSAFRRPGMWSRVKPG
jgi:malonate decarboxylase alpha subunit